MGLAAWPAFVTGRQISRLREKFGIDVQSSHLDRCGGLEPIGSFCFSMTLPVVVGGLFIAFFIFAGTVFRDVSIGYIHFYSIMDEPILFTFLILFLIFLPLVAFVFFMPLWSIHAEMFDQKIRQQDDYSNQVRKLEQELRTNVRKEDGLSRAKLAKEKIEVLQAVNPLQTGFPVWPFRVNMVITLVSPQILGVASTIVSLIKAFLPEG